MLSCIRSPCKQGQSKQDKGTGPACNASNLATQSLAESLFAISQSSSPMTLQQSGTDTAIENRATGCCEAKADTPCSQPRRSLKCCFTRPPPPPCRPPHVYLNIITRCSYHLQVLMCLALDPRVAAANFDDGDSQHTSDCSALSMQAAHATYRSLHTTPGSNFTLLCTCCKWCQHTLCLLLPAANA